MKKLATAFFCLSSFVLASNHEKQFSDLEIITQNEGNSNSSREVDLYNGLQTKLQTKDFVEACSKLEDKERVRIINILLGNFNEAYIQGISRITSKDLKDDFFQLKNDMIKKSFDEIMKLKESADSNSSYDPLDMEQFFKNYAYILDPERLASVLKNYFKDVLVTLNRYDDIEGDFIEDTKTGDAWADIIQKETMIFSDLYLTGFFSENLKDMKRSDLYREVLKVREDLTKKLSIKINIPLKKIDLIHRDRSFSVSLSGLLLSSTEPYNLPSVNSERTATDCFKRLIFDTQKSEEYLIALFLESVEKTSREKRRDKKIDGLVTSLKTFIRTYIYYSPYKENNDEIRRLIAIFNKIKKQKKDDTYITDLSDRTIKMLENHIKN